jgi:hypothetical protein
MRFPRVMTFSRWLYPRLMTSIVALAISLLALEIGIRVINAFDQNYLDELDDRHPVDTEHLTFIDLIRVNPDQSRLVTPPVANPRTN